MSDTPRDARWNDAELPSELSELLRAGREPLGTPDEVAELGRRLSALLGPAAGLSAGGEPAAPGAAASPLSGSEATAPGSGAPALGAASRAIWALGGIGAAVTIGVAAFVLLRGPTAAVSAPNPSNALETAPLAAPSGAAARPASASPSADAAPTDDLAPVNEDEQPAPGAVAQPPPPTAPSAPPRSGAARRSQGDGVSETALLEQARAKLQARPAQALQLTRQHQARFPHGVLTQEREVIAIEALERLGRREAASARAAEFERRYRGSVHRPRLMRGSNTSAPAGGSSNTPVP